ncbi:UDP-GalNAc:beta-1,3-N-acetylgalactosaminyltransferase 1-like isoform X3 [Pomacea canaliculata]|uniref:UDP-GalNAc:beta-1, 3-N-acetylgalactosaminyltransferase 1-like isoform X3 n=1 Tax=Pomacea canaliculata TaxID=400727 RepID=UPI000D73671E|nr:UDP-GalNAc:beta-1,3-N-acetylgalactosaminyltransferase 1-like isoform X3 [Pomacea canaliculata]
MIAQACDLFHLCSDETHPQQSTFVFDCTGRRGERGSYRRVVPGAHVSTPLRGSQPSTEHYSKPVLLPSLQAFQVRILFLLGLPTNDANSTVQSLIELEHKKYGDTLQGDFIDTYNNLTHKGVMGYRWITQYCPHVRLVAKIDDDVFVDTFKLLHRFWPVLFVAKSRAIFCNVWHNNTMTILREGKWKVNEENLQHFKYFPWNYCSGMAVFITGDLIPFLYRAAFRTPFFWIDDVYLFGMLPDVVGNVTYYDIGFSKNMSLNNEEALKCMKTQGSTCPVVVTSSNLQLFPEMWDVTYEIHRSLWKFEATKVE